MSFNPDHLLTVLRRLAPAQRYLAAFSGGCDSTVLLHALVVLRAELSAPVAAVHVDHGLNPRSGEWSAHCQAFCDRHGVPLRVVRVDARPEPGESPEAAARRARYAALIAEMTAGDALLTAHQRDDQAETFLLQLLRGAGPRGLAAMGESATFGPGWLLRPLLAFSRADLCVYARAARLAWIDDPSNFQVDFDRNFLRHEILPRLEQRWPAASKLIARASTHQAESAALLDELAAVDEARAHAGEGLAVAALRALSPARARNLIRYHVRRKQLPPPDAGRLERILSEVLPARADAAPCVRWPGAEVRRYREIISVLATLAPIPDGPLSWQPQTPLAVPGLGILRAIPARGGFKESLRHTEFTIRFAVPGASCRPAGDRHTRVLKKWWQAMGVPPWVRERTPLLYVDGTLAAVAGHFVCENFASAADETGWMVQWETVPVETEGENEDNSPGHAP